MKAESAINKPSVRTLSGGHYTNQGCVVTMAIMDLLCTAAGTLIHKEASNSVLIEPRTTMKTENTLIQTESLHCSKFRTTPPPLPPTPI